MHTPVNTIARLDITIANPDPFKPFSTPEYDNLRATGFKIDSLYLLTNAHAVTNSIDILVKFPNIAKSYNAVIHSICPDRDLAIIKLINPDSEINNIKPIPIGDHLSANIGDDIITYGYPFNDDNIKITNGIISGFVSRIFNKSYTIVDNGDFEDSWSRDPSYIQISAPINPGNSGGPLIKSDKIIGINAAGYLYMQSIAYSIGSMVYKSISQEMMKGGLIRSPTWNFNWMRCDDGIFIRRIYPDSCLNNIIQVGDILTDIEFNDPMNRKIHGKILSDGNVSVNIFNRNLSLAEIIDIIPINSTVKLKYIHDEKYNTVNIKHSPINTNRIRYIINPFESIQYLIFAGLCVSELTLNHLEVSDCPTTLIKKPSDRFKPKLMITYIFPWMNSLHILNIGDNIRLVNGHKVNTINELRNILSNIADELTIITYNNKIITLLTKEVIRLDSEIYKSIRLDINKYPINGAKLHNKSMSS